ncbi:competence protein ComEC [Mesonia phycicola]|uniref:Competence protein ComEC n=1 Tax=Mesonia phycicola TaxID=579105 RepID=A0A1M6HGX2_9FLAO|nr:ComEC/Rec2 family competence protein [Mesonia phycicola]SHJ21448.1 competence protein ComEC [Mesonia phycicola]
MKLVNNSVLFITVIFIIGIIIGHQILIALTTSIIICGFVLFLFILLFFWKRKQLFGSFSFTIITVCTFLCVGVTCVQLQYPENQHSHYLNSFQENTEFTLNGIISSTLKQNTYYHNYIFEVQSLNKQPTTGKLLLSIKIDSISNHLKTGSQIIFKSKLKDVYKTLNPHQFNYSEYLQTKQIYKQATINNNEFVEINTRIFSFKTLAEQYRNKIKNGLINQGLSKNQLAFTNALLLGERKDLDKEIYNDFASAGVVHILAISGLHIGIISGLLLLLFKPLQKIKYGKYLEWIIISVLLWAYAFLIGNTPSVLRAVTMFTCVNFGFILNRKGTTIRMLCLSIFILLVANPYALLDVGFQMSYLAVLSIISFMPIVNNKINHLPKITRKVIQIMSVSVFAQLGVLPISLYYFHQFPTLFLLANLIILPGLGIILGYGLLIIVLSLINIKLNFLVYSYGKIIDALLYIIHQIAMRDSFVIKQIFFNKELLFSSYIIVLLLYFFIKKRSIARLGYLLISIIIFQCTYIYYSKRSLEKNSFYIFHQNRNTILAEKQGFALTVYNNNLTNQDKFLNDLETKIGINDTQTDSLKDIYLLKNEKVLLVVDSLGVYNIPEQKKIDYLLLRNSPKINLERVLKNFNVEMIIADGSNYKTYVKRWKNTCKNKKAPFHYTSEQGAFVIDY